jgi:hypothetical protein
MSRENFANFGNFSHHLFGILPIHGRAGPDRRLRAQLTFATCRSKRHPWTREDGEIHGAWAFAASRRLSTRRPLSAHMFSASAEFERALIRESTRAGLKAAKRMGERAEVRLIYKLTEDDLDVARTLLANPDITVSDVADRIGVSPATLYRYMPRRSNREYRPRLTGGALSIAYAAAPLAARRHCATHRQSATARRPHLFCISPVGCSYRLRPIARSFSPLFRPPQSGGLLRPRSRSSVEALGRRCARAPRTDQHRRPCPPIARSDCRLRLKRARLPPIILDRVSQDRPPAQTSAAIAAVHQVGLRISLGYC